MAMSPAQWKDKLQKARHAAERGDGSLMAELCRKLHELESKVEALESAPKAPAMMSTDAPETLKAVPEKPQGQSRQKGEGNAATGHTLGQAKSGH